MYIYTYIYIYIYIYTHSLEPIPLPRRSDDNASVKPKMLYASSKDALKKALNGIAEEYQATDRGDLDLAEIKKKAGSC